MQRGWLMLGLVLMLLALGAAPARAAKAEAPTGEATAHDAAHTGEHKGGEEHEDIFRGWLDLSIWTIVVFLVLFFVMAKFAWKPMLTGLKEREDSIRGAMDEARAAKEEATKLRAELQTEIAKARAEGQAVRDEARRDAERLRDEIAAKAKADMQVERERLRTDMDTARDQVLAELWAQTAQLSTMVAAKAVRRQITIEDQNRLVDEALADLRGAVHNRRNL